MKNLKAPERFENAVTKLYEAYHNGNLQKANCSCCAVGNLLNGYIGWYEIFCDGRIRIKKESLYKEEIEKIEITGYSWREMAMVEKLFELNTIYDHFKHGVGRVYLSDEYVNITPEQYKQDQFKGLEAVVIYLCKLDNLPNIMDYTSLFSTETKKELSEVF